MKKKRSVDVESAKLAKREDYADILETIRKGGFCPFCEENLFKHHRKPLLFKTAYWLVTENGWPYAGTKHHFLLIARPHVESIESAQSEVVKDLHKAYARIVKKYGIKGGTLVMRSGRTEYTGATVSHLHAQIIVGRKRRADSLPITAVAGFKKP